MLLPHFTLSAKVGDELQNAHTVSNTMLEYVKTKENRIFPVEDWLYSVARVREKYFIGRMLQCLLKDLSQALRLT